MNNIILPISVLIMTQNEESNIKYALNSVINRCDQVIVTDSYSSDGTIEILKKFPKVEVYENDFKSWADQRNWMLNNCNIRNEIVFFLDADEYLKAEFFDELGVIIYSGSKFDSIYLNSHYIFLGSYLKYAYGHPKFRRIFKRSQLSFTGSGAREYANKDGIAIEMKTPYIHHDRKPIAYWIDKHNSNAEREANLFWQGDFIDYSFIQKLPWKLKLKNLIRNHLWNKLPLLVRPFLYFTYRYIFQFGFIDGRAGLIYCYLHAFWYQSLIDIKIIEKKQGNI